MATSRKKAAFVSINDLSKLVDSALADAVKRSKIEMVNDRLYLKWELLGRRIASLDGAEKFASIVAKNVSAGGVRVQPAVLILKDEILAGFFPVDVSLRELSL